MFYTSRAAGTFGRPYGTSAAACWSGRRPGGTRGSRPAVYCRRCVPTPHQTSPIGTADPRHAASTRPATPGRRCVEQPGRCPRLRCSGPLGRARFRTLAAKGTRPAIRRGTGQTRDPGTAMRCPEILSHPVPPVCHRLLANRCPRRRQRHALLPAVCAVPLPLWLFARICGWIRAVPVS